MNDAPVAARLALGLTLTHVNSARPDAPVVPDPPPRWTHPVRAHLASGLRRAAAALEPCEPMAPQAG
ncbi:MAG TPA: hypothetical protein VFV89_23295 [Nocardioides sp.]|uniref:hypothetical protein n=1 Tax=Nocardioides sp. TaxID=35761 RepID=UPI002E2F5751|nr:hypothetical protein [Nocardioides sp.]HEX5090754.1 hypothetical protein [Nocardioides sp.]